MFDPFSFHYPPSGALLWDRPYAPDLGTDERIPSAGFVRFPRLPAELRVMIWKLAIEEPKPEHMVKSGRELLGLGIQYFSVFRKGSDDVDSSFHSIQYQTAAPRTLPAMRGEVGPYSWFNNRSLYTLNLGLLHACGESRHVVSRMALPKPKRNRNKVKGSRREWFSEAKCDKLDVCLYQHYDDLFCFEFQREDLGGASAMTWNVYLNSPPLRSPFRFCTNVGFEFHPSWLDNLPEGTQPFDLHLENSTRGLFARCMMDKYLNPSHDIQSQRVYLIDRTLEMTDEGAWAYYKLRGRGSAHVFSDKDDTFVDVKPINVIFPYKNVTERKKGTSFHLVQRIWKHRKTIPGAPRNARDVHLRVLARLPPYRSEWEKRFGGRHFSSFLSHT